MDIKPGNVLFDFESFRFKLADFGEMKQNKNGGIQEINEEYDMKYIMAGTPKFLDPILYTYHK